MGLDCKMEMASHVCGLPGWHSGLSLPLDVHMPLIASGAMKDPVLSDYCDNGEWVERRSWWFRKAFDGSALDPGARVCRLTIESLDAHGDVFLNGAYLGHHASAHYPFTHDVREYLRPGENVLLVRLTSGLEYADHRDVAEVGFNVSAMRTSAGVMRGDLRRAVVRKPTYVYGWDWCPRIGTVAIAKGAYIDETGLASVRGVGVSASLDGPDAALDVEVEVELLDILATHDADVEVSLSFGGAVVASARLDDVLLRSGLNYVRLSLKVRGARLWWPNGMGPQDLYEVKARVVCEGAVSDYPTFKYGIRTVALDVGRAGGGARDFRLVVNGVAAFCKGGNWIPADSVYARVTPEKYAALISEAVEANFNMLRIWGGGIYERDEFYDECDARGILIWQDMMFCCAAYPDHIEAFYDLVSKEVDYQTKRLRNRACLALLCGNNENHWIYGDRGLDFKEERQYGLKVSNVMMPEYVRKNCPWVPYWNSSPYGGANPNSESVGDVHHWHQCMMNPDMGKRIDPAEYDKVGARFVSEYGYPGPCAKSSIERYFDGAEVDRGGRVWDLHNNTFEKYTVNAGIRKHYTDRELGLDEYILYAGMAQSLMIGYSLESFRAKAHCGGALFWMYNDCWGEVGWTIVDYYLTRKVSFYGARRAFAPRRAILRAEGGAVTACLANDSPEGLRVRLRYGYVSFDGGEGCHGEEDVAVGPYGREAVLRFGMGGLSGREGTFYVSPVAGHGSPAKPMGPLGPLGGVGQAPAFGTMLGLEPATLRLWDLRELALCPPRMRVTGVADEGADAVYVLESETYVHGAHLKAPDGARLSDNYFDMLPGESKAVRVYGGAGVRLGIGSVPVDRLG